MFGIGDNKDQNNYANSYSGGVATQPMTEYQHMPPAPAPNNSMPGFDSASMTPPAQDPASIPSAPPMASTQNTVPLTPPIQPAATTPVPEPTPSMPPATPSVSLEHAYIPTDPPQMANQTPADAQKPTAASLFTNNHTDDLVKMKQQALEHLEPLIDKLDQTPEEKFKTTMMLIQASDNSELLKEAYDAANAIKDEKMRAQALLDVINEINYFTQQALGPNQTTTASTGQIL